MSWWGMEGLETSAKARTDEERAARIAEAGFDGINGPLPPPEEAERWRRLLERYGLSFSVNAYPRTAEDLERFLTRVQEYGSYGEYGEYGAVQHVNVQVMMPFVIGEPAVDLLRELDRLAGERGIPVYIETHRGTITQDLLRTVDYVQKLESLRLTIDLSHYVVAGEMHTVSEEAERLFDKLLRRASAFHARVSNGEQVQVDVGPGGEHPMLRNFERWWGDGMRLWQASAGPGDVLPFVVELGPPPYAIALDEHAGRTAELGDRWQQSLLYLRTARRLWAEATEGSGRR
ncbi:sugar phosphate isomerase/epimerase [Cohnella fermenti]|uniref:Sugar phosphate isomerase/epimerase n=2 Tax=Cohnella fermenti TaxID=2565925 RepID=A0A4V3WEA9_9BACL|nr:TIM barrel protein [Cohnella fermenti]THF75518.1 sugar phosphate isomerase/epimerase [Cohnella fermenti]